ncbi:STAS domain-containing protein [Otariodibacter oris]|uniref:Phospholipid transport system transporter-binding protein n=1 Tax=Otariodibacter oris TaxID=1032623 RepID=A0A420XFZ3_9PAST|nr:STAS domain-containing protein [Otariodibacter oris]QGM80222.1 NTP binding protein (Contains STAS domain) [Otariodibacter oris]RKR71584.1 phospholipid transport system transporter-binding protein [Otariodibacter oris]
MKDQKSLEWKIQQNNDSLIIQLIGELTRDTLMPLWDKRDSLFTPKPNQHVYWDLKLLDHIDSAGFTLFTELLNHYNQHSTNCIINTSNCVKNLADLFDLSDWLGNFLYCDAPSGKN